MMRPFHIRSATDGDRTDIAAIHSANWQEQYCDVLPAAFLDHRIEGAMREHWNEQPFGERGVS